MRAAAPLATSHWQPQVTGKLGLVSCTLTPVKLPVTPGPAGGPSLSPARGAGTGPPGTSGPGSRCRENDRDRDSEIDFVVPRLTGANLYGTAGGATLTVAASQHLQSLAPGPAAGGASGRGHPQNSKRIR